MRILQIQILHQKLIQVQNLAMKLQIQTQQPQHQVHHEKLGLLTKLKVHHNPIDIQILIHKHLVTLRIMGEPILEVQATLEALVIQVVKVDQALEVQADQVVPEDQVQVDQALEVQADQVVPEDQVQVDQALEDHLLHQVLQKDKKRMI
jgi:hypothetical protein